MSKVRIIALYIQHRDGVPDEDRRRLYQHARLTLAEQDAVTRMNSRVDGEVDEIMGRRQKTVQGQSGRPPAGLPETRVSKVKGIPSDEKVK